MQLLEGIAEVQYQQVRLRDVRSVLQELFCRMDNIRKSRQDHPFWDVDQVVDSATRQIMYKAYFKFACLFFDNHADLAEDQFAAR